MRISFSTNQKTEPENYFFAFSDISVVFRFLTPFLGINSYKQIFTLFKANLHVIT